MTKYIYFKKGTKIKAFKDPNKVQFLPHAGFLGNPKSLIFFGYYLQTDTHTYGIFINSLCVGSELLTGISNYDGIDLSGSTIYSMKISRKVYPSDFGEPTFLLSVNIKFKPPRKRKIEVLEIELANRHNGTFPHLAMVLKLKGDFNFKQKILLKQNYVIFDTYL